MIGEEDVLFRPVLRGMLRAESLLDGSVDLQYVMLLNEAIIISQENQYRAQKAAEKKTQ